MNTPVGGAPPPDTTPPTVTITAPAGGALVRGSVNLTATATDNSGTVASVQFLVDDVPLGAPDTASPFAMSWTTSSSGNGPHVLKARATDAGVKGPEPSSARLPHRT